MADGTGTSVLRKQVSSVDGRTVDYGSRADGGDQLMDASSSQGGSAFTLGELLNLTPYQRHLLQQSWPKVLAHNRIHGGNAIFAKFGDRCALGREIFQKLAVVRSFRGNYGYQSALKRHDEHLVQLIHLAMQNLNNEPKTVLDTCVQYGESHASVDGTRLTDAVWDQLIEAILEHVHSASFVRKHREASKVWTMLITMLVDKVREGYKRSLLKKKKTLKPMRSFESPY